MSKRPRKFTRVLGWNREPYSERSIEESPPRSLLLMLMCNLDNFPEVDINSGPAFVPLQNVHRTAVYKIATPLWHIISMRKALCFISSLHIIHVITMRFLIPLPSCMAVGAISLSPSVTYSLPISLTRESKPIFVNLVLFELSKISIASDSLVHYPSWCSNKQLS